jgi:hypothetical protein
LAQLLTIRDTRAPPDVLLVGGVVALLSRVYVLDEGWSGSRCSRRWSFPRFLLPMNVKRLVGRVRFSGIGRLVATPSRPSLALCPFGTLGPSRALSSPFIAPLQLNGSLLDIGSYPPAPTLYIRHFPVHRYARDKGLADCRSSAARIEPFSLSLRFGRTWPPLEKSPRERMQRRIIVQCAVRYGIHRRASLDLPRRTVIRITYSRRAVRYPSFSLSSSASSSHRSSA